MNNLAIFIIITLFLVIFLSKLYVIKQENMTNISSESDEAIQNLGSLYNKDKLTIGKLKLGNKWTLSAIGDAEANDDVLRMYDGEEKAIVKTESEAVDSTTIHTGKLQLGDKWLFSGVGDAYSNDDWLRLYKTDGSNAYYGGLAAGRLYDARVGDLQTMRDNLQGGINSLNSQLSKITGVKDNTRCVDGYDMTGEFATGGIDDCGNQCRSKYPNHAFCAQLRKSDNHCWCKSLLGLVNGPDTNFQAKLLPPVPPPPPPLPPGTNPCSIM